MSRAYFRFYAELNDFLPLQNRRTDFRHDFHGRDSIKDMIESLGVPHAEIDLILVNGRSVDFAYIAQDGDRVSVYPVFEALDITPVLHLRPRPLRETKFLLDTHLGRLAAYLRLLGFDASYRNDFGDEELARLAAAEKRILLTKDRGLLKRNLVTHGYCIREIAPRLQAQEVVRHFDLMDSIAPFTRCLRCNGRLSNVEKQAVADQVPAGTQKHYDEFHRCDDCGQVYWPGSHYKRMQKWILELKERASCKE